MHKTFRSIVLGVVLFSFTPVLVQAQSASPLSYDTALKHAMQFEPDLLTDAIWEQMTERQISAAQSFYNSRANSPIDPIFSAAQVENRNATIAARDLMPYFKAETMKRAKTAPLLVSVKHELMELRYDQASGKLVSTCCFSRPRIRPGYFDLIYPSFGRASGVPSNSVAAYQPSDLLPAQARALAVYEVRSNLGADDLGDIPGLSLIQGNNVDVRPQEMVIALDRHVELDGIPMTQAAAEALFNSLSSTKKVHAHVELTVTGAEKGQPATALYGTVRQAYITAPDGSVIARFGAAHFPEVSPSDYEQKVSAAPDRSSSATAADPVGAFDVVGINLDIPSAAADKLVREHMAVGWVYEREKTADARPLMFEKFRAYVAADLTEVVLIYSEPSNENGRVVAVRRHSMIGKPAPAEQIEAALIQKYGTPDVVGRNQSWVWGKPGGCSASGTGPLSLNSRMNLKHLEGGSAAGPDLEKTLANALDLVNYSDTDAERNAKRFAACGPVLQVLGGGNVMTTLVDMKIASEHVLNNQHQSVPQQAIKF